MLLTFALSISPSVRADDWPQWLGPKRDGVWESTAATTYDAGRQKWSSTFIIPLGDTGSRCLLPNEHGDLIFADLTPTGYKEISRAHLIEPANRDPGRLVVWSEPAFADRCIFWRNDNELVCASLAAK